MNKCERPPSRAEARPIKAFTFIGLTLLEQTSTQVSVADSNTDAPTKIPHPTTKNQRLMDQRRPPRSLTSHPITKVLPCHSKFSLTQEHISNKERTQKALAMMGKLENAKLCEVMPTLTEATTRLLMPLGNAIHMPAGYLM